MSDEVEVTTTSWISRLGNAFTGVIVGIVLIPISMYLLWWNEGRSVDRYMEISYAKEHTVETPVDTIDSNNEGKLVHFAGKASTQDVLTDPTFGVTVKDSYKLSGNVEVYQWIEKVIPGKTKTEKKLGGKTVQTKEPDRYEYTKGWSSSIVNSSAFKEKVDPQTRQERVNPTVLPYEAVKNTITAKNVNIGAHKLVESYISGRGRAQDVELVADQIQDKLPKSAIIDKNFIRFNIYSEDELNKALNGGVSNTVTSSVATDAAPVDSASATETVATTAQTNANVNVAQYQVTLGQDKIGDVRISFTHNPVGDVTVIAKQVKDSFEKYIIDEKKKLGYIDVRDGLVEAKDVFASNESAESMTVWILRILGFGIMAAAFGMIFKPISVLADIIPLFGDIAESGISIVSGLLALVISATVIAIAWLFYRPVIACCLLLVMAAGIFGLFKLISAVRANKKAKVASTEPSPEAAA